MSGEQSGQQQSGQHSGGPPKKTYKQLTQEELEKLDSQIRDIPKFQIVAARALVCDYGLLKKTLKDRNPFRGIRHYIQAVMLDNTGSSEVDLVTQRLVSKLYDDLN